MPRKTIYLDKPQFIRATGENVRYATKPSPQTEQAGFLQQQKELAPEPTNYQSALSEVSRNRINQLLHRESGAAITEDEARRMGEMVKNPDFGDIQLHNTYNSVLDQAEDNEIDRLHAGQMNNNEIRDLGERIDEQPELIAEVQDRIKREGIPQGHIEAEKEADRRRGL